MIVDGKKIIVNGRFLKIASLEEEWYEDVEYPERLINAIKKSGLKADIFTFWQRLPDIEPKYNYHMEYDPIAAIPIADFDHWWTKQINAKTRNVARKAEKTGVEIKVTDFNDDFAKGMTVIFNETPVRQGKPFWHYGKTFETIKKQFSRYIFREDMIGAYYKGQLIGFIMLAYADEYAVTGQILSMIKHRDKSPTNALLAKAVQICAEKNIKYLVYAKWVEGSLGDFKKKNGFKKYNLPRYYIPISTIGRFSLSQKLHHGFFNLIPQKYHSKLIDYRKLIFDKKNSLFNKM